MNEQVKNLKNSFRVEGIPIIKSDRFSDEELKEYMKTEFDYHNYHLRPKAHRFTDDEIEEQIKTMTNQKVQGTESEFNEFVRKAWDSIQYEDIKEDKKIFVDKLESFFDREGMTPLNGDFWGPFWTMPFCVPGNNDKLKAAQKKFGAKGMHEIFGSTDVKLWTVHAVGNASCHFERYWGEQKELKDRSTQIYSSPFKDLDDIEDNVVVKKIKDEALKFYLDKTKDFEKRLKVFDKHGEEDSCIYEPSNRFLNKIFDIYFEQDYCTRHETITSSQIVEWWIEALTHDNKEISYARNEYHPNIISKKRKYEPAQESIERLRKYYLEKLFIEGVGSFELDW